jgi:hypothetical protein
MRVRSRYAMGANRSRLSFRHRVVNHPTSPLAYLRVMRWEISFRRDWNAARATFRLVTGGTTFVLLSVVLIVDIDCTMGACYWHDL